MRKPAFCICENKDADQLRGNREADQRLCFRYTDSAIPLLPKSEISIKPLAIFCDSTARFVSYLVGNPEDRFFHNEAQFIYHREYSLCSLLLGKYPLNCLYKMVVFVEDCIMCKMWHHPCNVYPLTSHFYISKLGFTGVFIIFLFLL